MTERRYPNKENPAESLLLVAYENLGGKWEGLVYKGGKFAAFIETAPNFGLLVANFNRYRKTYNLPF